MQTISRLCLLLAIFCKFSLAAAEIPAPANDCGFTSKAELVQAAQDILGRFSKLSLNELNFQGATPSADEVKVLEDIKSAVSLNVSTLISNNSLQVITSNGLFSVVYDEALQVCSGMPCALPNTFKVLLPPSWLTQFKAQTGTEFSKFMLFILGHEFGHHVYDAIFRADSSYPRVNLAGPITPLKYHLTVDAIGAELAHGTLSDMAQALSATLKGGSFEGDGAHRLECLTNLPDRK